MKNHVDTTPLQSFESTIKDTKNTIIKPKFNIDKLTTEGFKSHIDELIESASTDFPVAALPARVQEIIKQTNESLSFPIPFIAAALLHAVSTAIGNTHVSKWKWIENACIYLALVGNPGTIKTHPITWAYEPFSNRDRENYKHYKEEDKNYQHLNSLYAKSKKSENVEPPVKPVFKKYIISDCTPEALVDVLQNNPRGVCSHNDELAGWINNFNRYSSSGGELQMWLQLWSVLPVVVDRKSSGPVRIERPFVNVIGTLQPAVLDDMGKDRKTENGFTHRVLFVKPQDLKRKGWNNKELNPAIKEDWHRIINRLLSLDFANDQDGNEIPIQVWLTPEAQETFINWTEENIQEDQDYNNETRDEIPSKMETYALRFSLILQLLKWACDEAGKQCIEASTVKEAIQIVKYFKRSAIEVAEYISNKNPIDRLPEIKQMIYRDLPNQFETGDGLAVAIRYDMIEKTFKNWLKDSALFKRVKHGTYQKIYA